MEVKAISMVWLSRTGLTNLNAGEGGSNLVDLKKYRWAGREYPYVSGQAMRFYLKEAIRREVRPEEACVADEQGETCGRIPECVLCDLFGFMITLPEVGAVVRVSPVKVSPAMGLIPLEETMTVDFLTRRHRGAVQEEAGAIRGDIVNVEMAVNLYKVGLAVDLRRVGREEELVEIEKGRGKKAQTVRGVTLKDYVDEAERRRRIRLLLDAVQDFSDYSKQARLLTDFTPDLLLVALQANYSHRLQKALEIRWDGAAILDTARLDQVLRELQEDVARADERPAVFAGMLEGVIANGEAVRETLGRHGIEVVTPREAIARAKAALGV
ncbi:type I-B CRISPR-associated protein Cas7/Cst2/DevR [Thermoflexus sp.]|uniref:type I-B CRISPR-associated protein Cas7/Cst2/DevR n=1 Tax=Thermoflexus sp. TaxID=1969742 RepID=UPI00177A1A44|nr:type I-B CRISPR-associated protein Cas7/Cst2/DevR [Thermoflexus sp.]